MPSGGHVRHQGVASQTTYLLTGVGRKAEATKSRRLRLGQALLAPDQAD